MNNLQCRFVDYRMAPKPNLSAFFSKHATLQPTTELAGKSVALITCQRTELYTDGISAGHGFFGSLASSTVSLNSDHDVLNRLANVCSGVESWFLGEKFISEQVNRAFSKVPSSSLLRNLADSALRISSEVRADTSFYSEHDYPEVAFELIQDTVGSRKNTPVFILGAGMLGRSVAKSAQELGYEDVTIISRDAKRERQRSRLDCNVLKFMHVDDHLNERPFVFISATTDVSQSYRTDIHDFLKSKNCLCVIDLCAVPLIENLPNTPVLHMYGDKFSSIVQKLNTSLVSKVPHIQAAILDKTEQAIHDLRNE